MILVTGATGRVGSNVVRELLARGEPTRAFVRDLRKGREVLGEDVELAEGDFERPETIEAALEGVDRLFVLTPSTPLLAEHERNILQAGARARVRVVKQSWLLADERSPLDTGRGHWQSERELERTGLPFTLLHPVSFMDNFLFMISGGAFATSAGEGKIGLVDVRDVAAVAAVALSEDGHEGKRYVITGPEALSFDEAATILSEATGVEIRHIHVSPEELSNGVAQATGSAWLGELLAALYDVDAVGQEAVVTDVVQDVVGRRPRSLGDFARDYADALAGLAGGSA